VVDKMEYINKYELERKIGYLDYLLVKLENDLLKRQSDRIKIKLKLVHLRTLKQQVERKKQLELINY
jgi:hypothetical protein